MSQSLLDMVESVVREAGNPPIEWTLCEQDGLCLTLGGRRKCVTVGNDAALMRKVVELAVAELAVRYHKRHGAAARLDALEARVGRLEEKWVPSPAVTEEKYTLHTERDDLRQRLNHLLGPDGPESFGDAVRAVLKSLPFREVEEEPLFTEVDVAALRLLADKYDDDGDNFETTTTAARWLVSMADRIERKVRGG